jgi:hypothetical protein
MLSTFVFLLSSTALVPQIGGTGVDGPFTPMTSTVLDTTANGGVFQFTMIVIPSGVSVALTGTNPAVLQSQGVVDIAGTLGADGERRLWFDIDGGQGGAGGYRGGNTAMSPLFFAEDGEGPGGGYGGRKTISESAPFEGGGSASHVAPGTASSTYAGMGTRPVYGSAYPFDLRGGSGGGAGAHDGLIGYAGAGGGGAIAILADGAITVSGRISANGGDAGISVGGGIYKTHGGPGSGGAILLRSLRSVTIEAAATIDAQGGWLDLLLTPWEHLGGDGLVRIDAYGADPVVLGGVNPAPLVLRLPHLRELAPPRIGQTWRLSCASVPGDVIGLYAAQRPAYVPVPPHGAIELAPPVSLVSVLTIPLTGIDPMAVLEVELPPDPDLVGTTIFFQASNHSGTLAPVACTSNGVRMTVKP